MPIFLRVALGIDRFNRRIGVVLRWIALIMILIGAYAAVGRYLTPIVGVRLAPNVGEVNVELVFDPPWSRAMMSEEAQLELGLFS